jgi:hypothetical protein
MRRLVFGTRQRHDLIVAFWLDLDFHTQLSLPLSYTKHYVNLFIILS